MQRIPDFCSQACSGRMSQRAWSNAVVHEMNMGVGSQTEGKCFNLSLLLLIEPCKWGLSEVTK